MNFWPKLFYFYKTVNTLKTNLFVSPLAVELVAGFSGVDNRKKLEILNTELASESCHLRPLLTLALYWEGLSDEAQPETWTCSKD